MRLRRASRGSCAARASRPSARTARRGRRARRPAGTPASRPGWATRIRSGGTPSSSTTSAAVKSELTKMTSHVRAAFGVLRAVHRLRLRGRPLGKAQRHEVVDRRRAHAAALRRVHPVGEVEDVERAERRARAAGRPSRLQASRQRWANGSGDERSSTSRPSSASWIVASARGARRRERDDSCWPAAASASPPSEPRM